MFINDVNRKEEIQNIAIQHLKKYGIKYRPKKARPPAQVSRVSKKFFKTPLHSLPTETVTLSNGQQLTIPKRIHEICMFILSRVHTEGIFRKEGSKSRQNEIKLSLDRGCSLGTEHHVIDVAVVLKSFLRDLPEPLIPTTYNDLFLMCNLEKRSETESLQCLLLVCLLLPSESLNVLSYLMQFFYEVASFSATNRMNVKNLSILVGPNLFSIGDKLAPKSSLTVTRICDITRLLIESSKSIGVIPDYIIDQIGHNSDDVEKKRKNKRRSGSLTRMLNGLKKIVSAKIDEEPVVNYALTPDILRTPTIHASIKKKRAETGLSAKKKKEVLTKLPDCALLNAPFSPTGTPVCINPRGKKSLEPKDAAGANNIKEKKISWYMRSRSMKNLKDDDSVVSSSSSRTSLGTKSLLERRWSAVSNAANFRKKKRHSCTVTSKKSKEIVSSVSSLDIPSSREDSVDYVRVSKSEFEDFKSRVSAIERRISRELDNVQSHIDDENNDNNVNHEIDHDMLENVQTAYEKTLETGSLSPATDQLARRLSRDLKIRRSGEERKFIRSPSARKIGTIRRRSTEREKKQAQIIRNQSWHFPTGSGQLTTAPLLPKVSLRRKRRLSNDEAATSVVNNVTPKSDSTLNGHFLSKKSSASNSNSLHLSGLSTYSNSNTSELSEELWQSAESFFSANATPILMNDTVNGRSSIAKLRSQNVGMVRAKARLFDSHVAASPATPLRSSGRRKMPKVEQEKRISPRRKQQAGAIQKQRLQNIGMQYARSTRTGLSTPSKDLNGGVLSPRNDNVPYIKVPLMTKTPMKRLCRTPAVDKRTPFKAVTTPF